MSENYHALIRHYEHCLEKFGDSHRGVDWPNEADAATRYRVMLDVVKSAGLPSTLLDFGCGASHLYQYIQQQQITGLTYAGLDASRAFCDLSRQKYPENEYLHLDVLTAPEQLGQFDYIVMNGVFTEKRDLSFDDMFAFLKSVLKVVFSKARRGIAFNVMSKQVDWERDDLFHVPTADLTDFIVKELSRHYVVRNDYGLYEYTTYIYREPQ